MLKQFFDLVAGSKPLQETPWPAPHRLRSSRTAHSHRRLRFEPLEDRQLLAVTPVGDEFLINTYTTGSQSLATNGLRSAAMDADGDFVIAWISNGQDGDGTGIYAQLFNSSGAPRGSEFRVHAITLGNQTSPTVAMDADGDFVVAWTEPTADGSISGIVAQRFDAAGTRLGSEFRVNSYTSNAQSNAAVSMDASGDFVIVWASFSQDGAQYGVYGQRFDSAGVRQGTEFRVNVTATGNEKTPAVSMDADGDFVVAWTGNSSGSYDMYARVFDASGVPVTSDFRVNTYTTGTQGALAVSAVSMDADGDFVVAWRSNDQDGDSYGLFAQRFNALGQRQGTEFQVGNYTTGRQIVPNVTFDASGDFVMAWASVQDGANYGVYAQRFSADGTRSGSEFRVNTTTEQSQTTPMLAGNPSGDFVVVWASSFQDGDSVGVYAQRYDESTDAVGPMATRVYAADAAGTPTRIFIQDALESEAIPKLLVVFSENMTASGLANINSVHNWQLTRQGVDISNQISGIAFSYNSARNRYEALLSLSSPLTAGSFELTTRSSLVDLAGNRLDGNGDVAGFGEDYVHRFTIGNTAVSGSEFRVNTYTTGRQSFLPESPRAIAMDDDGDFVVVWTGERADGILYDIYAQRYNASGVPQGSEFRVNTFSNSNQRYASVAMDADGDFVVTWRTSLTGSYDIYARRFNAAGVALGSEFRVNTYTPGVQYHQSVEMNANGDFVVAWSSADQDGESYGVYAQRYDATGAPVGGGEFRVNTYTTGSQRNPSIGMDDAGNFVVTWFGQNNDLDNSNFGVFGQRYDSAGNPLGSEFLISSDPSGTQNYVQIAMTPTGEFVAVWMTGNGIVFDVSARRFDASGMPLGSEFRVNQYTTGSQSYPRAAIHANGSFVVTWQTDNQDGSQTGVYARTYDASGAPETNEFRVNTYTSFGQSQPMVAMDALGDYAIVWRSSNQDGNDYGIYAQRFASRAVVEGVRVVGDLSDIEPGERLVQTVPAGPSLAVTFSDVMLQVGGASGANSVTNPANWKLTQNGVDISAQIASVSFTGTTSSLTLSAALGDGQYVLTAKSTIQDADGRALDGDANGSPGGDFTRAFSISLPTAVGSEFRVNSYTTGNQTVSFDRQQLIAADRHGNFVVTWASPDQGGGIFAQLFNAAGLPKGSEFRVNSPATGNRTSPTVAMDANGNFVITWTSENQDGSGRGIYAQRFSDVGIPLGSEFRVNSYTTGEQTHSSVAMDSDGDFVVTWTSENQDGHSSGIYARRFEATGRSLGSEFRVNTYTTGDQSHSAIAVDAIGDFVVTWMSTNQDSTFNRIYGQRFSSAGVAQGTEFRANALTGAHQWFPDVAMDADGDYVIAWYSGDGSNYGVFAQRFNSQGIAQATEFRVNSYTTGDQSVPSVAIDIDGDFVVTWTSGPIVGVGQDGDSYGVYAQRYSGDGKQLGSEFRVNTFTTNSQAMASVSMDADGDFVVAWSSKDQDGSDYGVFAQRFAGAPPLEVISITPTYAGFEVEFNRDVDPDELNLYDGGGTLGAADVTLTGASTGTVRGSVVVEPGSHKLTFIKSGGPLAPDVYTIGMRSSAAGFIDPSGNLLDGNGDGFGGDDYLARFTITPPPTGVTLGIGDLTRGYGQAANVPASSSSGVPIAISNAVGQKSASFAVVYDPALLNITGATLGSGITGSVTLDTTLVGIARITVTSGSQLSSTPGTQTLVNLAASVPASAPYGSKQVLELSSITLTNTALALVPAIDDDATHIAAYFGDANGSQTYNAPDATLAQRIIVGLTTGLAAYPLADPNLIIDINGNGQVQSDDVTQIQRAIVGLSTPEIPALPNLPLQNVVAGGPDPIVSISRDLRASVGGTLQAPVRIEVTEPTGDALESLDLAIAYDPAKLEFTGAELGELLIGFGLSVNSSTPGLLKLSLTGSEVVDLPHGAIGELLLLDFKVLSGSGTSTPLNLLARSAAFETALYDDLGRPLTLSPAPTNAAFDEVDGSVEILPGSWETAVDAVLAASSFGNGE